MFLHHQHKILWKKIWFTSLISFISTSFRGSRSLLVEHIMSELFDNILLFQKLKTQRVKLYKMQTLVDPLTYHDVSGPLVYIWRWLHTMWEKANKYLINAYQAAMFAFDNYNFCFRRFCHKSCLHLMRNKSIDHSTKIHSLKWVLLATHLWALIYPHWKY